MSTLDPADGADHHPAESAIVSPTPTGHLAVGRPETVTAAFSAFYRTGIKPLIAYLVVNGVPAPIAADIAQECMTELLGRCESVDHPRAYVYKCAGRMWGRKVANLQREAPTDELPESTSTSLVPHPDALVEFEARHAVFQMLRTLPPR
ncbi:RNA polymerase sigma factor [Streptomyces sp. NPDC002680]|uniref:RNA polymerase sigma factor n=1 Tax=Streptomyces sp. NPDC002680 TaxID=3364659 RepID=UPI0036A9126C